MHWNGLGQATGIVPLGGSRAAAQRGFTLLELLVVVSIMALATAGVGLAMRDSGETLLEREAARLNAMRRASRVHPGQQGLFEAGF